MFCRLCLKPDKPVSYPFAWVSPWIHRMTLFVAPVGDFLATQLVPVSPRSYQEVTRKSEWAEPPTVSGQGRRLSDRKRAAACHEHHLTSRSQKDTLSVNSSCTWKSRSTVQRRGHGPSSSSVQMRCTVLYRCAVTSTVVLGHASSCRPRKASRSDFFRLSSVSL